MTWTHDLAAAVVATRERHERERTAEAARLEARRTELERVIAESEHAANLEIEVATLQQLVKRRDERVVELRRMHDALADEIAAKLTALRAQAIVTARRSLDESRRYRLESDFRNATHAFAADLSEAGVDTSVETTARIETALAKLVALVGSRRNDLIEQVNTAASRFAQVSALDVVDRQLAAREAGLKSAEREILDRLATHASTTGSIPALASSILTTDERICRTVRLYGLNPLIEDLEIERRSGLHGTDPLSRAAARFTA